MQPSATRVREGLSFGVLTEPPRTGLGRFSLDSVDNRNEVRERAHLFELARATPRTRHRPARHRVRPGVRRILDAVGWLRAEVGRDAHDRALSDLVGELSIRSNDFRVRWAADNVRFRRTGVEHLHHPHVGDLTLSWELLDLTDPGLTLLVYSAEPDTTSHDSLNMLASLAATREPTS